MRRSLVSLALALAGALPSVASAIVIDFEAAGFGSLVDRVPPYLPELGVVFGGSAFALVDEDSPGGSPGTGNFARAPSPIGVMTFFGEEDSVAPALIDYAEGFNLEISFSFSTISSSAFVEVYSGLGGTGDLLGRIDLPALGSAPGQPFPPPPLADPPWEGDDYGDYNNWEKATLEFEGLGKSIVFGGTFLPPVGGFVAGDVLYDDISLSFTVPEPSTYALMFLGLAAVGVMAQRRRP